MKIKTAWTCRCSRESSLTWCSLPCGEDSRKTERVSKFHFEAAKKLGPIELAAEFGPLLSSIGASEFIYGVVAAREITKTTSVMFEVHASSRVNLDHDVVTLNFGWRHNLSEHAIWIASLGHDVHSEEGEPLALIGYCGLQLLY